MESALVVLIVGVILGGEWWLIRSIREGSGDPAATSLGKIEGHPSQDNGEGGWDWGEWPDMPDLG